MKTTLKSNEYVEEALPSLSKCSKWKKAEQCMIEKISYRKVE